MRILNKAAVLILKAYKKCVSPFLGNCCRFYPSCSDYSAAVFKEFSFLKAVYLTVRRVLKCHPWHSGGYDPPPKRLTGE